MISLRTAGGSFNPTIVKLSWDSEKQVVCVFRTGDKDLSVAAVENLSKSSLGEREGRALIAMENMTKDEIIDLLNRSWMTHDGMWFYHCFQECGIATANRVNKAAIRSLAPMEMARMKKALGITWDRIETFDEFKNFFTRAARLCIPPFMNGTMDTSRENVLHWEFAPKNCFAYKGMKRIGAIDSYECGVIYRLACWFDAVGLTYKVTPEIKTCQMLSGDTCGGDFVFNFGQAVAS